MVRFFGANVDTMLIRRRNRVIQGPLAVSSRSPCGFGDGIKPPDFGRFGTGRSIRQVENQAICRGIAAFQAENGAAFQKSAAIRS
jgi:hypothetical protein